MEHIGLIEIILYVNDQSVSTCFYEKIFRKNAELNVPGMTEFVLAPNCKLGLMPNNGIVKILQDKCPHPSLGNGIPRCELYLYVADLDFEWQNALQASAKPIAAIAKMNWGDTVGYVADPDGHIIAFAQKTIL